MPTYVTTTTTRTYTAVGNRRMGDISLNTRYLSTNRGIIKILQVLCGFIIISFLCTQWYRGNSCFGEGRMGFASGLNFVCVIINIVVFILNFLNIGAWGLERIYSIIGCILFLIAAILVGWFMFEYNTTQWRFLASGILLLCEFVLYLWDVKILQGESPN